MSRPEEPEPSRMRQALPIWFQRQGPLSSELLLTPGKFGLGKVPASKTPDATTPMICGFCSTGCSLDIHLRDGQAVNLSPTTDYPVNQGLACPKGWEALNVLRAPNRATTPLLRGPRGSHASLGIRRCGHSARG